MRIAIISDTHSRYATVAAALEIIRKRGIATVIHCGDITDSTTVRLFDGLTTHFVYGNCDGHREELRETIQETGGVLHGNWGHLQLEGRNIAWTHGDDLPLLRELENSGIFDFVFHGHTHHAAQRRSGNTWVVNPGALQRARIKTFIILDLQSSEMESIVVE